MTDPAPPLDMTRSQKGETRNYPAESYRCVLLIALLAVIGQLWGANPAVRAQERDQSPYIAPFVATPHEVVERMLELAEIRKGDVLYDLGSGDGRIVLSAAARYGVKAIGFDIDPNLVKESREAIRKAGLEHLAEIHEQDIRNVDLSPATVITMYLYPAANLRLRSAIQSQLKPGSRVLSLDFSMGSWQPDRVERITDSSGLVRTIYVWRVGGPSTTSKR